MACWIPGPWVRKKRPTTPNPSPTNGSSQDQRAAGAPKTTRRRTPKLAVFATEQQVEN